MFSAPFHPARTGQPAPGRVWLNRIRASPPSGRFVLGLSDQTKEKRKWIAEGFSR
jgi:hypothetical protein